MKFFSLIHYKRSLQIFFCCASLTVNASEYRHEQKVADLAYGVSLYHLFQDEKLAAITDLTVAKEKHLLNNNPENAELLLASLYFDYGLPEKAETIFGQLLDENISASVKNRVWFNLARVQYEAANFVQAEVLLNRISKQLTPLREAEKQYILSELNIRKQSFDRAQQAIAAIDEQYVWRAYSEYNLGIALTTKQNAQYGHEWLEKLIARNSADEELLSLQDSARLVLGLSLLQQNKFDEAIEYFSAIRVSGLLSNKALLATGWAWSRKADPEKALIYWKVLLEKRQVDDATLEAYLATAYAYEQLGNNALAAKSYKRAVKQFQRYMQEMDGFIKSIKQMDLINTLYNEAMIQTGSPELPESNVLSYRATPYIQHLVASKSFQHALQNYRELLEIKNSLARWKQNLPVFELMLAERSSSFENKRPQVEQSTDFQQLENLRQQRTALAEEVGRVKDSQDIMALADEDEADYLERLEDVKLLLSSLDVQQDLAAAKEKYRLIYGLLYWDISTDFPRRYWQIFHQLQLLDRALSQAEVSARSLQQAASIHEAGLADLGQRIIGQNKEIEQQQTKVSGLIEQQEQLINQLAIEAIKSRKQQLVQLRLNARYSLTRVYDEIAKQRKTQ